MHPVRPPLSSSRGSPPERAAERTAQEASSVPGPSHEESNPGLSSTLGGLGASRAPSRGGLRAHVDAPAAREPVEQAWQEWAGQGTRRERRKEAIERIRAAVSQVAAEPAPECLELSFFQLELTELPPRMDEVPELRKVKALKLSCNQLEGALDLRMFDEIEAIEAAGNQLTHLPKLANPQRLLSLRLEGNRMANLSGLDEMSALQNLTLSANPGIRVPPDLRRLVHLREVYMPATGLQAMPDLRGLNELELVLLYGNDIPTVPRWAATLPNTMSIGLDGNPLNVATLSWLEALRSGPRITHASGVAVDDGPPPSLARQVRTWLPEKSGRWEAFAAEPEAGQFARLLRDLTRTADYQNSEDSRRDLARRVVDVLGALEHSAELREQCFAAAREGLGTCGDRVALTFSDVEVATQASRLKDDPGGLQKLARGLFRLDLVNQIALERINAGRSHVAELGMQVVQPAAQSDVDEVEVALGYRILLAEALELPGQPRRMLYERCANLDEERLEAARRRVLQLERQSPELLVQSIAQRSFWREYLGRQPACVEALARLEEERAEALEHLELQREAALAASGGTLNLEVFEEGGRQIMRRHASALEQLYLKETEVLLSRDVEAIASEVAEFEVAYTGPSVDKPLESGALAQAAAKADPALPPHMAAQRRVGEIVTRLLALKAARPEEAPPLASTLLDPVLLQHLDSPWQDDRTRMGGQEMRETNLFHARYLDLLGALAEEGLLDAREVFDRLTLSGGHRGEDAPHMHHVASRIGGQLHDFDGLQAVVELARSAARLLSTLRTGLERQRIAATMPLAQQAKVRATVHEEMSARLLAKHGHVLTRLRKAKYQKHQDFFSRALLGNSPRHLTHGSKAAAIELMAGRMMPPPAQAVEALGAERVKKMKLLLKEAMQAERKNPTPTWPTPALAQVARQLAGLDIVAARHGDITAQENWSVRRAERLRQDTADYQFSSAVASAINGLWEQRASALRRELAPSFLPLAVMAPLSAAAYAGAANSVALRAPDDLVRHIGEALKYTAEGQAVMSRLRESGQRYCVGDHPAFDARLTTMVATDVTQTLEGLEQHLLRSADALIETSNERDTHIAAARKAEQDASDHADTAALRARVASYVAPGARNLSAPVIATGPRPGDMERARANAGVGAADATSVPSRHATPLPTPMPTPLPTPMPTPLPTPMPTPVAGRHQFSTNQLEWEDI